MSLEKKLLVIGISHHRTPLAVREKFAVDEDQISKMAECLLRLAPVNEVTILNTCNRFEIYLATETSLIEEEILQMLSREDQTMYKVWRQFYYVHSNSEMILHLFSVASGLDSQMVGETEILGQVKRAIQSSREQNWSGKNLGLIFERASQAAKWARTHTGIGQGQVTIGSVAVDLATRIFGDLEKQRILLVGSGEVAEKTAQSLFSRGAKDITITGRTHERAHGLAEQIGAATLPFDSFRDRLAFFDILICSTAATDPILLASDLQEARRTRRYEPILVVDVAVPRDVESSAADLEQIFLYNIDDLASIANENLAQRLREIEVCREELNRKSWRTWLNCFRRDLSRHYR